MNLKLIISRIKSGLVSGLLWLTKPATSLPDNLIHQSVLLAWTLLLIIPLAIAAIIVIPPETPHRTGYIGLILALVFVFIIAFIINRVGHYRVSSALTITGAVLAPWGSLMLDPVILQGDIIPLNYVMIPVLLSSIFLPPVITTFVAALHLAALAHVYSVIPFTVSINWISLDTPQAILFYRKLQSYRKKNAVC